MKSKAIAKLVCEQVLFWLMLLQLRMRLGIASTSGVTSVYRIAIGIGPTGYAQNLSNA